MSKAAEAVALKAKASELRLEAKAKTEELSGLVQKQLKGELEEGESRLSAQEIAEKNGVIAEMLAEAKSLEDLDTTEGLLRRSAEANPEAARILNESIAANPEDEKTLNDKAFESLGHFLRALRTKTGEYSRAIELSDHQLATLAILQKAGTVYSRDGELMPVKEVGDMDVKALLGSSGGGGEALVPTEHMTELLKSMGEEQQFIQRARQVPMVRRTIDFPRLVQSDATDTRPMFGFAAITKIAEGALKPEHEPEFEQFALTAVKYAAYLEAGDELLQESIVSLQPLLVSLLTGAIAYEYDRDGMRGSGTGEPQGFIGSGAEFPLNRTTIGDVTLQDIFAMESRFFGTEGIYLYHPSVIPDLYGLSQSNIIVWNADLASGVPGTLLGRPLVRSHKLPTLGNKGDISLVDPSMYLAGNLQAMTVANSLHFKFQNDLTAWRAVFQGAGSPWPKTPFSAESDGAAFTYRVSPFVVLDIVQSS